MTPKELVDRCHAELQTYWMEAQSLAVTDSEGLPQGLIEDIDLSINSTTKTHRYVLPTQILAKVADPTIDCRCIQSKRGGSGAFDARTIAHQVIVPFDQLNERLLGGSSEPYVNNPLRVPEVSAEHRHAQKDKPSWDRLCRVLQMIEDQHDPRFTIAVFQAVLQHMMRRLSEVRVVYPVPNRPSFELTVQVVNEFLKARTGGIRLEAMIAALMEVVGTRFQIYQRVRRTDVNAADSQSGTVSDIECVDGNDEIILAIEAKDRAITAQQVTEKLPLIREKGVTESLFLSTSGIAPKDQQRLETLVRNEFATGQNIYLLTFQQFLESVLVLIAEAGRREYLVRVGLQLDKHGRLEDRQEWARLLRQV